MQSILDCVFSLKAGQGRDKNTKKFWCSEPLNTKNNTHLYAMRNDICGNILPFLKRLRKYGFSASKVARLDES